MTPNLDRHTIVMANIVDFMILAIENWYDEIYEQINKELDEKISYSQINKSEWTQAEGLALGDKKN